MRHYFIIALIVFQGIVFIGACFNENMTDISKLITYIIALFISFGLIYWCW